MLIHGFALFWLTSVTTLNTDSNVEVRLLDNQNAPLTALFDMSKANERLKQFVSDAIETKMIDIENKIKQQTENIERILTFHFPEYLHGIADKMNKEKFNETGIGLRPRDCGEINLKKGNGIYTIFPNSSNSSSYTVFCDFETDSGNWTVFQRRINGTTDFFRGWEEYENGFGNLEAEFWLGNKKINELMFNGLYELRVDLTDFEGNSGYAKYSKFSVGNASTQYKLEVGGYEGNLGEGLQYNNGKSFSTKDRDNDRYSKVNCANDRNGAWWYMKCTNINLNGRYLQGGMIDNKGITWYNWKDSYYSMKSSVMMFRKVYPPG
ncbi:Angiopoietin-related protein 1,Ficolin-1-A,Ryncolin-1,Tenascin-N,Angiopoietin-related protein 7,Ficolin-3,Fibroleukin,Ficolin-1,Ficolin-1-B,Angiopoietin-4,Tenascin-R,Ryncolin-2,Techylectin-5B,Microfibril-associat ed glycoprotein 4,Fibrinogen-like protein A,Ryncolin-3,Angiopoietin-2,Tenascin-X,Ficolin-2,Tenascin,Angiopoietin-related protein 2,Ryncolin-4 [Mytilus edulis]|uniref:Fibrinogen C-terminal domain-containing protein n=1 Tax=Mytilus edulis TaxID=6550 RepID=A0A8S3T672_MYTED|nr:Angiopoietin-related protein 1,Ficolin-1-A,Ryncolin-1,Tenascin-N,Angiopoietin-related protein 7,Ficolin-3,Fibroleukin,Ficolin-1,Ficolin-1-B,Angiopoietin-4,Tenascin-R,Ryncolin-2,Techylectin-5B,Microfibril-associat ed glycoprotein 4,Fibrinogen-like protein A,Ryncolin-3,Angiopoietin-2,Tenascin-X,Ficolin-2,Tenascin,Angiopoietin-related protein 2,Ryncolin-4 [Mytilus edulis]